MDTSAILVPEKVLAGSLLLLLSLAAGLLPLSLSSRLTLSPQLPSKPLLPPSTPSSPHHSLLPFLLDVGGGLLLANCLCHWMPEVRGGLTSSSSTSAVPLAEVVVLLGLLGTMALEGVVHRVAGEVADSSLLRTTLVLVALSLHSLLEGLVLALEAESGGVWVSLLATALHKVVLAFTLGVEMVGGGVQGARYLVSILVFSTAPLLGCTAGLLVSIHEATGGETLQVLQGLATGAILYVVFFEVFPKARQASGPGLQHLLATSLGATLLLPSLYFHSVHG